MYVAGELHYCRGNQEDSGFSETDPSEGGARPPKKSVAVSIECTGLKDKGSGKYEGKCSSVEADCLPQVLQRLSIDNVFCKLQSESVPCTCYFSQTNGTHKITEIIISETLKKVMSN